MNRLWHRWHPEVALRYLPAVECIKKERVETILEVGSGSLGIAPYINQSVTGLDIDFTGPSIENLTPVKGSIEKLPFKNNSFDAVLCIDVLEHIPATLRGISIEECLRVTKKIFILGVPTKETAQREDIFLMQLSQKRLGKIHPFFADHARFGLPSISELRDWIERAVGKTGETGVVQEFSNENVWLHRWLMKGWLTDSFFTDLFFRKILLLFVPVLRLFNAEPAYRRFFVVTLEK